VQRKTNTIRSKLTSPSLDFDRLKHLAFLFKELKKKKKKKKNRNKNENLQFIRNGAKECRRSASNKNYVCE